MDFFKATAEQVVKVTEAVVAFRGDATLVQIAEFADYTQEQTESATKLSASLGLITLDGEKYNIANPLCRFLRTPSSDDKAAVIRIILEDFLPFVVFREELDATGSADIASVRVKAKLGIDLHREHVKATLVSLATYSRALVNTGGETLSRADSTLESALFQTSAQAHDVNSSELVIRELLGENIATALPRDDVLLPLARALIFGNSEECREAILNAGNAIETYLGFLGQANGYTPVAGAGIGQKLNNLRGNINLPLKIKGLGDFLANYRNAADHGIDGDVGSAWSFSPPTGLIYFHAAISFIRACQKFTADEFEL